MKSSSGTNPMIAHWLSVDVTKIPDDTAMIYVGKAAGKHSHSQHEINDLLATYASAGKVVVRLKGGDPFLFGRGGEEMQILEAQGVDAEVVPGITAASGIGAALGVPLTHRDYASRVLFLTGISSFERLISSHLHPC